MKILNQDGIEVHNPDLSKGYLISDYVVIAHHDAVPAVPQRTERVVEWESDYGRLYKSKIIQEYVPAKSAWDETEKILRYILYTPEELAEREALRQQENKQTELNAKLKEIPDQVEEHDEAIVTLYEGLMQVQAENDEAITAVYEILMG